MTGETRVPVSVVVPVRNEAHQLARCLASVDWADEIFVVDSGSTDDTAARAEAAGATVVQFQYDVGWPRKKNWALEHLPFRNDWVLLLDADEVLRADAREEMRRAIAEPPAGVRGYWINRRFLFMDRWLRHAYYPNWNLRLFQHRCGRFERLVDADAESGDVEIHEHVVVDGGTARLDCEIDHYAFPTVQAFVDKHNRYASWEAHLATAPRAPSRGPDRLRARLRDWRRHAPFRPLLRFCYVYFWQRGFLDGLEGYYFARLHACYELMSVAKTHELRRRQATGGRPAA
jgi:glycosyltransferase involved in cell wall biosynthesis